MEFNQETVEYIKGKVYSDIIGNCCDLSNANHFRKGGNPDVFIRGEKSFIKIKFLIKNFSPIIDIDNLVDDFYSKPKNNSQWNTKDDKDRFKSYIVMVIQDIRDEKIEKVL